MERNPGKATTQPRNEGPATTRRDETSGRTGLDACYGRIGIPAVAAALTPRHDEQRPAREPRVMPWDRD